MPLGVFVPARWTDLSVDVHADTGTVAQGGIPYKGSDGKWHGLAPGTAGQSLRSNGAGADPSWVTPFSGAHSALTGLTTGDDHTQYALLAGRSGGQTLNGDTASGGNLTLNSTAHATKGKILLGASSAYDGANIRLGVGVASPLYPADIRAPLDMTAGEKFIGSFGTGTGGSDAQFLFGYVVAGGVVTASLIRAANSRPIRFATSSTAIGLELVDNGSVGIGLTPTAAHLEIKSGSATRRVLVVQNASSASVNNTEFRDGAGNVLSFVASDGAFTAGVLSSITNTVTPVHTIRHNTVGTAAAGFGSQTRWLLESSTTEDRDAAQLAVTWATATDASRKARAVFNIYDTAAREAFRIEADGTNPMIGFLGAGASVRQTSGANLTNNVTSGGTNDTIADFTDLTTYANDAATIRNDIYQLARKLKQVNDALRTYGLLT